MDLDHNAVGPGSGSGHGHRLHQVGVTGGVAGVHHHGQVGQALQHGHHGQIQGVAGVSRLIGTDAALTENDILVAVGHDVLGAHQQLLDGPGQAALEQDGLLGLAQLLQHVEVLGVSRAHLDHVHLLEQRQVADVHDLGDNGQAGGLFGFQQQADALGAQALEVIGRGTGLERTAPQEVGPGGLHLLGNINDLLLRLHRAGAGNEAEVAAADGGRPGHDGGVVGVELAVDRLERVGDPCHGIDDVQALQHFHIDLAGVADEAQDGLVLSLGDVNP